MSEGSEGTRDVYKYWKKESAEEKLTVALQGAFPRFQNQRSGALRQDMARETTVEQQGS